mmetsp:Transcript_12019/g.44635  ORF Transcript_12019/g.44635 Transcript_12019/m.44635 type:complete len:341 (-) Transcript_12019:26-1048(-)
MGLACCVPHLACCVPHLACCVPHLAWRVPRCFQPRCRTRSLQRLTSSDFKHARSAERQNQPILIRTRQKTSVLHKTRDGPSEKQKAKSKKAKSKPQKAKAKSKQKSSEIGCHSTKRAEGQVPPPSFHVHLHRVHEKYVVQIPRCPPLGDRVDEEGRAVPRHRDDVQEPIQQHDFLQGPLQLAGREERQSGADGVQHRHPQEKRNRRAPECPFIPLVDAQEAEMVLIRVRDEHDPDGGAFHALQEQQARVGRCAHPHIFVVAPEVLLLVDYSPAVVQGLSRGVRRGHRPPQARSLHGVWLCRGELRRVAVRRRRMWSRVGVRGGAASRDGRQARADDRQET